MLGVGGGGLKETQLIETIPLSFAMIQKEMANTTCQTLPFMLRFEERDPAYSTVKSVRESMCVHI